ncbi:hypothetical protein LCGC14_2662800, partial [marine sediment metagenome]
MRIIRVFPRRTKATPTDPLVYCGPPDLFAEADEIHISVAFTWDLPEAEKLVREWHNIAHVKIGGPATGESGGDFVFGGSDRQYSFDPLSGDVPLFGGEPTDEVSGGAGLGGYLCYDHHLLSERGSVLACAQTVGAAHRLEADIFHCDHRGVRAAYGDDHR